MPECPKCHFVSSEANGQACPKCGLVYAKVATTRSVRPADVVVTTADFAKSYSVLSPVYANVTNKGAQLEQLARKYSIDLGSRSPDASAVAWAFLAGEIPVGHEDFPKAFAVCIEELKRQTIRLGGNAIVGVRQNLSLDTNAFQFFYMQVYGTAVRIEGS